MIGESASGALPSSNADAERTLPFTARLPDPPILPRYRDRALQSRATETHVCLPPALLREVGDLRGFMSASLPPRQARCQDLAHITSEARATSSNGFRCKVSRFGPGPWTRSGVIKRIQLPNDDRTRASAMPGPGPGMTGARPGTTRRRSVRRRRGALGTQCVDHCRNRRRFSAPYLPRSW